VKNGNSKTENYLREYAFIFFAQKNIILLVTAIVFILAAAVAFLWPPLYGATGSIIVKARSDKIIASLEDPRTLLDRTRKEDLFSEATILTSNDVILRAVEKLERRPDFSDRNINPLSVKSNFTADILPSSNIIDLQFTWDDPMVAEKILDVLMETYLSFRSAVFNPPQQKQVFADRSENYMRDIEGKQQGLLEAIKDEHAPNPALEIQHNLEIKKAYTTKLQHFKEELADKEVLITQIESELGSDSIRFFSYIDIDTVTVLNSKLQELIIKRNNIRKWYSPESKKAVAISREVAETAQLIRSEAASYQRKLKDQVTALKEKVQLLHNEIERIDERNLVLKSLDLRLQNIDRESDLLGLSFDTFARQKEEADFFNKAGPVMSYVSVIAEAHALDGPVFPDKTLLLPLGLAAGLLLGLTAGFVREFMDHRFKRPEDVERQLGLPVVLSIPDASEPGPGHRPRISGNRDVQPGRSDPGRDDGTRQQPNPVGKNNKYSTLLGWSDNDDVPPSGEK
jgi:uncharacterized protein involved in exopolysaccharide biosynthesis